MPRDAVTGLRTESSYREVFPAEFSRAREAELNGAILLVKLGNIMAINARHGRDGGDEALRAVGQLLLGYRNASPSRSSHVIFKLGGPFCVYLMPACTKTESRACAEEILERFNRSDLYIERLIVSIGIVNFYEFFAEEGSAQHLATLVDKAAAYRVGIAERQGANTICDASETAESIIVASPLVLVVEPDPLSIGMLLRGLETAGFAVHTCEDGETAVAFAQGVPPALIICEAMSPRLNGFAVRQRLRANSATSATPFILVSHKKTEELIRKAADLDIRHFFRKPLSITEIVGLARNLARGGQQ